MGIAVAKSKFKDDFEQDIVEGVNGKDAKFYTNAGWQSSRFFRKKLTKLCRTCSVQEKVKVQHTLPEPSPFKQTRSMGARGSEIFPSSPEKEVDLLGF